MGNRRYVKRIWRVPKDRGALDYLATLTVKLMVKHGWPVKWEREPFTDGFLVLSHDHGDDLPPDIENALSVAVRIIARTYRIDVTHHRNFVELAHEYEVTKSGHFKKVR